MPRLDTAPSYVVLRIDPAAGDWARAARARGRLAPDPIRTLLSGRSRVEVALEEAKHALDWAATVPGWNDDRRPPLFVYTPGATFVYS